MSTLLHAVTEALASHDMDWRIDFDSPLGPDRCHQHVFFCSCGAEGFDSEDEHRAAVAIAAVHDWLDLNDPAVDVDPDEWVDGFWSGHEATIALVKA